MPRIIIERPGSSLRSTTSADEVDQKQVLIQVDENERIVIDIGEKSKLKVTVEE